MRDRLTPVEADAARPSTAAWWIGHATIRVHVNGLAILTDPLLRPALGPLRRYATPADPELWRQPDLVLVSHAHHDHLDLPSLRLLGADVPIVVPRGLGRLVSRAGFRTVEELGVGQALGYGGVSITALAATHHGSRPPAGPRAVALEFLIEGDETVFFAGDTALQQSMGDLRGAVDLALIPVGGWGPTLRGGHMDPAQAAEAVRLIEPRAVAPVHWGTYWPRGLRWLRRSRFDLPGGAFAELVAVVAPDAQAVVVRPGERIEFSRGTLLG